MSLNLNHELTRSEWVYRGQSIPISDGSAVRARLANIAEKMVLEPFDDAGLKGADVIFARHTYAWAGVRKDPQYRQYEFFLGKKPTPLWIANALISSDAATRAPGGYLHIRSGLFSLCLDISSDLCRITCRYKDTSLRVNFNLSDSMSATEIALEVSNDKAVELFCGLPARKEDSGTRPISASVIMGGTPFANVHFRQALFATKHFGLLEFFKRRVPVLTGSWDREMAADNAGLFKIAIVVFLSCACICYRPTEPYSTL